MSVDVSRGASFRYDGPNKRQRLPQLLAWERYTSPEAYAQEREVLFRPAWHCVGVTDDLPHEGDARTVELLGWPLVLHHQGDRIAAFHNVCPHRNALLVRGPAVNLPKLRCGYHGWEFNRDGVVCKVPGGECFKPMKAQEFALAAVRVEVLGRLIFVCLDDHAPALTDALGPEVVAELRAIFSPAVARIDAWTVEFDCNWKVLVENTLEDYHVSAVHFATSGDTPPPQQIQHTLGPSYNLLENKSPAFTSPKMAKIARLLRAERPLTYLQYLSFPALIFVSTPVTSHLHLLEPTSPTTCRTHISVWAARGPRPLTPLIHSVLRRPISKFSRAFVEEDRVICADVQRGLAAARFPGALSAREERVHHFQAWVQAKMGG